MILVVNHLHQIHHKTSIHIFILHVLQLCSSNLFQLSFGEAIQPENYLTHLEWNVKMFKVLQPSMKADGYLQRRGTEYTHCSIQRCLTADFRITYLDLSVIFVEPATLHCC
jgi:hypothetical protein